MHPDPWAQWRSLASSFAPFEDLSERFNAAARAYFDGAANAQAPAAAAAARSFSDALRELFSDLQLPWNLKAAAGGAPPMSATNSPALGASRESQLRAQRMAQAWRRIEEAQRRLQRFGADAVREAAATFAAGLAASPPQAPSAEALHKLYGTWIDCAEDAYSRAVHGEPFCNALADYVNASSEWRKELQAEIEHSAKLLDLPTRSEINSLTQRLRAVEHELRTLRAQSRPKLAADSLKRAPRKKAKP